jgi:CubicO group peptidase (beta-lactamase class C family)
MRSEVFQPIGMTHSTFAQPLPQSLLKAVATGHYAGGEAIPGRFRSGPELAVAGLWTTPTDIAKYVLCVQKAHAGSSVKPLSAEMSRQMLTPGIAGRGLGPVISGHEPTLRFGHDGFNEGFESSFVGYITEGRGAVVMANSGFAFMLIREVLGSISRNYDWHAFGQTTQQPPAASMDQQLVASVSSRVLVTGPGTYRLGDGLTLRIRTEGQRLLLEYPGNGVAEVFATADGRYFCPQLIFSDLGSPWLGFSENADGSVIQILAGDDASAEFRRIE